MLSNIAYVDGYLVPVPKDNVDTYRSLSESMGRIWKEYGAISYVECVADDVPYGELTSFPRAVQQTEEETVVFAFVTYASREARDDINRKVMDDPRVKAMMETGGIPFDGKRMIFGGFRPIVSL